MAGLQRDKEQLLEQRGCVGVICDHVQDPQNFGAIMRTAAFFRCRFIAFAKDRQAPLSSAALRASAGGAAALELVKVTNLARLVEELKHAGLWVVASTCDREASLPNAVPCDRPYVLIVGNEERGVRPELLKHADYRIKIPGGSATLDSLNVAVATGVLLSTLSGGQGNTDPAQEVESDA
jgi:23S rRNA (guanosine2251-2'-O)-methyltransferase